MFVNVSLPIIYLTAIAEKKGYISARPDKPFLLFSAKKSLGCSCNVYVICWRSQCPDKLCRIHPVGTTFDYNGSTASDPI